MFQDFKNAFHEMVSQQSEISTSQGDHVVFPKKLFDQFQQEFNICFVEPEDDQQYKLWVEGDDVF
jgi:hypothetical protein